MTHGGDIYRNNVSLDFSVNVNPLGIPKEVKKSLMQAVLSCDCYPDIHCEKLKEALASAKQIEKEEIVFGNGASELFLAIVRALKPKRCVIPVPSFLGYEKALQAVSCDICFYPLKKEKAFQLDRDIMEALTDKTDLLFLANPNNPVGNSVDKAVLMEILSWCEEKKITVVLDECFIGFLEKEDEISMLRQTDKFSKLIVVQAFTKLYALPGVRLGYLVCGNREFREEIKLQLPEWNVSLLAQEAGGKALSQTDYLKTSIALIKRERKFLTEKLQSLGIYVYESEANFLLLETELPLYEELLKKGILIRDCSNFRGFNKGFYRIAVKMRDENEKLLAEIGAVLKQGNTRSS